MTDTPRSPACASSDVDPEWFYIMEEFDSPDLPNMERREENRRNNRQAQRVCKTCPLAQACLEQNLREPYGIYGGLLPKQRQAILAERGLTFTPLPKVDPIAVELVVKGQENVYLSPADRREVVRRLDAEGVGDVRRIARISTKGLRSVREALAEEAA